MPTPKKLPGARQRHEAAGRDVALREEKPPVPIPPKGLLRRTNQIWRGIWESPVARAWDTAADMHLVERWIRAVDEYERVLPEFQKERISTGSTGQLVIHPLASYLSQLQTTMKACETELGLTPMSRVRLGIAIGEQKLTAMELNRRLNQEAAKQEPQGEVWEAEWEPA